MVERIERLNAYLGGWMGYFALADDRFKMLRAQAGHDGCARLDRVAITLCPPARTATVEDQLHQVTFSAGKGHRRPPGKKKGPNQDPLTIVVIVLPVDLAFE